MIAGRNRRLWLLVTILSVTIASLASGCLWGVVRDAETGAPVSGATVSYADSQGHTGWTLTDANGVYAFDPAKGPVPAIGPASFEVTKPEYEPLTAAGLLIEYNDNARAILSDPLSFWEIQNFELVPEDQWIEIELLSVDIERARLAPPGDTTHHLVSFELVDPAYPGVRRCSEGADLLEISSPDPPRQSLNILCAVPGDNVRAWVRVQVLRYVHDIDTSTASFDWTAPSLETVWQRVTLDSTDAGAPDDPDLEFTAEIRFRSVPSSLHSTP